MQLDNKKLEALPKGKDRLPVMQVSSFVLSRLCYLEDIYELKHLMFAGNI